MRRLENPPPPTHTHTHTHTHLKNKQMCCWFHLITWSPRSTGCIAHHIFQAILEEAASLGVIGALDRQGITCYLFSEL